LFIVFKLSEVYTARWLRTTARKQTVLWCHLCRRQGKHYTVQYDKIIYRATWQDFLQSKWLYPYAQTWHSFVWL